MSVKIGTQSEGQFHADEVVINLVAHKNVLDEHKKLIQMPQGEGGLSRVPGCSKYR